MAERNATAAARISAQSLKAKLPAWLLYSVLTILLWCIWVAISNAISNDINAYTNQVLFGLGMIPLLLLVVFSPRLKGGAHRSRGMFYAFITGILGGTGNIAFFKSLMVGGKAS